jgi:hypothetical protein
MSLSHNTLQIFRRSRNINKLLYFSLWILLLPTERETRNPFSLLFPLGIIAEITSFRSLADDPSRRDEFGTFLSKWRDYQFKVANSASSSSSSPSTATAAAATAVSASSTPRKIICNKIVIYARVPGKRAAQTLHSALLSSFSSSSLVARGTYVEVEDDGNDAAVNAFRRTL